MTMNALFDNVSSEGTDRLFERYRPQQWDDVVAQEDAIKEIAQIGKQCGLAGKAWWIRGKSGTGKTTIARLLANEIADEHNIQELDGNKLTTSALDKMERCMHLAAMGEKRGRVWIINEADGLSKRIIDRFKTLLEEDLPRHACLIFTTTDEGEQQNLWGERLSDHNAQQLLSRCEEISLSQRGLAKPFARKAKEIAQAEGLDGQPEKKYVKLMRDCRNNMRKALQRIQAGEMLDH